MPYRFKLSPSFVESYKTKKIPWDFLGEFTFYRTYSRVVEAEDDIPCHKEEWWETVLRVVEGCFQVQKDHCAQLKLPWKNTKAQKSASIMYDKIFNFKFSPPGRGLWIMGTDFIRAHGGSSLMNCAFISTEQIDTRFSFPFCWAMDALMLGVGVGFDTRGAGKLKIQAPVGYQDFIIPDSREGWVESVQLLLDAFFQGRTLPLLDYALIRPEGAPIKGFGGVASGPAPLHEMHTNLKIFLSSKIGETLTSVDIVDLFNHIAVCVVAGNVRRSAQVALGDINDVDYFTMKDPGRFSKELMSHRWASNNSVFAPVGLSFEDYVRLASSIEKNGEPGIVWLKNAQDYGRMVDPPDYADKNAKGVNPCGEQTLEDAEMCNLCETYPSHHDSYEEYQETLKYAYLYAKTVTLVNTQWPETNAVTMKNRRIGVSQSGIIDAFNRHGRYEMLQWCDKAYKYLRHMDQVYSDWLCIPRSKKITSVKPSGTVSLLAGVSPGIHSPHAEYYIRRIRIPSNSVLINILLDAGTPLEYSKYGSEEQRMKTLVAEFPIHSPYFDRGKKNVSLWEQIKNVADYQRWWSDNNVSVTVTFQESEVEDIPRVLESFQDSLKAVSFLPYENDYEQAPYEEITKEEYELRVAKISQPDYKRFLEVPAGEKFCDGGACLV